MRVVDSNGVSHNLSDFAGKKVVLEWTNHGCPYVKKHYNSKYSNMQKLQKSAAAEGVIWLSIVSSAPGKQGYVDGSKANALTVSRDVINADQTLVYQGAIDSNKSARASTIPGATNYVKSALDNLNAGQTVETAETSPYGCSIKYQS